MVQRKYNSYVTKYFMEKVIVYMYNIALLKHKCVLKCETDGTLLFPHYNACGSCVHEIGSWANR